MVYIKTSTGTRPVPEIHAKTASSTTEIGEAYSVVTAASTAANYKLQKLYGLTNNISLGVSSSNVSYYLGYSSDLKVDFQLESGTWASNCTDISVQWYSRNYDTSTWTAQTGSLFDGTWACSLPRCQTILIVVNGKKYGMSCPEWRYQFNIVNEVGCGFLAAGNEGICPYCGDHKYPDCDHEAGDWVDDYVSHVKYCIHCGEQMDWENHYIDHYSSSGNGRHTGYCMCGHQMTESWISCNWGEATEYNSYQHIRYCTNDCGNYVIEGCDSSEGGYCSGCGAWRGCLIEGTMIAMSDGTEKPIEEIKPGDLIKSWNPFTKADTTAKVVNMCLKGLGTSFIEYSFDNNTSLTIFGRHSFFDNLNLCIRPFCELTSQEVLLDSSGRETRLASKNKIVQNSRCKYYSLITSNNLYFANGILLGHSPYFKYKKKDSLAYALTPEIEAIFKATYDAFQEDKVYFVLSRYFYQKEVLENARVKAETEPESYAAQNLWRYERRIIRRLDAVKELCGELTDEQYFEILMEHRKTYFEKCFKLDQEAAETVHAFYESLQM